MYLQGLYDQILPTYQLHNTTKNADEENFHLIIVTEFDFKEGINITE